MPFKKRGGERRNFVAHVGCMLTQGEKTGAISLRLAPPCWRAWRFLACRIDRGKIKHERLATCPSLCQQWQSLTGDFSGKSCLIFYPQRKDFYGFLFLHSKKGRP
jgi:hypothetical protein